MVEVTEDDREIAAELAHALGMTAEEFTSGACDVLVQIAARHRQAGVQQGLDMAAGVAERLSNSAIFSEAEAAATVIQQAFAERDGEMREALEAYHRLLLPVYMTIAERDMSEEPLSDEATLFSFMGSGASDHTTVGDFRKATNLARQALAAKGDSRG